MRKTLVAAAIFGATVGGAGLALAQSGPPETTPPVEAPPADPHVDPPLGPPEATPPVDVADELEAVEDEETEAVEDETTVEVEDVTAGVHPDNHGADVSTAAHECPEGPEHGPCVSAVARDHDGDGTPEHGAAGRRGGAASSRRGG
jgi:hypothetical protein